MLKLYGFAISNYYNMVKHALLLKGIDFEEVATFPNAEPGYLAKSPLGKVPCIETEQGFLAETSVILDYLESAYPEKPLLPSDPWARAKVHELIKISELYIELQGRRLMPMAMMGQPLDQAAINEVRTVLQKGAHAVAQLAQFRPYVAGSELTLADLMLRYSLGLAKGAGKELCQVDLEALIPGLADWEALMGQSEISQKIDAQMAKELPAFLESLQKKS